MHPDVIGGRYVVTRAIGQGGMGTVWLARDETLAREVAVKQVGLLPGESVTDSARALREARSTAALSHRNVVTVFDVVEESDRVWLVMEHVPSHSLAELLRDRGALAPVEVARIGAQVADGLAAAHAAGIVHRDVKPGNVLVREDGVAKISDFGIARTAGDPALTQTGLFVGTPAYLSPESARGDEPTPASDVWSLGATLYAAVEGRPPYELSANHLAVLATIAEQDPPRPLRAGVLQPVLARMLDRNPQTRWSMADVAHALHRIGAREDRTLAATRDLSGPDRPAGRPTRAGGATGASAGGAAVGAAAAAAGTAGSDSAVGTAVGQDADTSHRTGVTPRGAPVRRGPAGSRPHDARGPRRRTGLLALALLAVIGAVGLALLLQQPDAPQAGPTTTDGDRAGSPTATAEPSATTEPSTTTESDPGSSEGAGRGTGSSPVAFIEQYFATVPEDTDTGWSMLGPQAREVGRDSYEGWWGSVQDVEVSDIDPAGDSAEVTLTYTMKDGRVETERQRLDLLRTEDGWLINGDERV